MTTRREFLQSSAAGFGLALLPQPILAAPAPKEAKGGVVVLDDCDEEFQGKETYADNLTLFDGQAKQIARISGLNICQEIGSPHRVAVDASAKRIWVGETVGHRLLQYDFTGKEMLSIPNVKPNALAIDPATNHVWVAQGVGGIGTGTVAVYDAKGNHIAGYDVHGLDIAYDPKSKSMWLCDTNLVKLSLEGKTLFDQKITTWCAISLGIDPNNGKVWVATREHTAPNGKNSLLGFDNDGKKLIEVELKDRAPFRVAVDPTDGAVWLVLVGQAVQLYSSEGKRIAEHRIEALTLDIEPQTGNAWVVVKDELLKIDRKGEILMRAKHKTKTLQAWIASW